MKPVNWGILGAAKFAREHMGPAIHAAKGARLSAMASRSPDKSAPFKEFCPDLRVHDSYDALLADPQIDAVYIPLPNHMHIEWSLRAVAAGKHVLCEKPIALQADQINALIDARDQSGLLVSEAYMIVHHPQWQRARDLLREGAIGELRLVDTVFSYDNSADKENIRNRLETGGGSLPDIGVYTFGAARFVTGQEPQTISAAITKENGVDVFSHITADFDEFRYSSVTSMRLHPRQEMAFHGTKGVMRLTAPFNASVFDQAEIHLERGFERRTERWPGVNQYVLQVENFCASLRNDVPYPWSLEDAKGTQTMIDSALGSHS